MDYNLISFTEIYDLFIIGFLNQRCNLMWVYHIFIYLYYEFIIKNL
jgi:hypothetical protein